MTIVQVGVGLAAAILIDVSVARDVLRSAAMTLLGGRTRETSPAPEDE